MSKRILSISFLLMILTILSMCDKKDRRNQQTTDLKQQQNNIEDVTYTPSYVNGNVAWSEDDSKWNTLNTDTDLNQGTFVETGKHSDTRLVGSIGDVVIMSEQAKIQLITSELLKRKRSASLAVRGIQLLYGIARFEIEKGKGQFSVETPTVKVNVKGTAFTVNVDSSTGKTVVAVIEGAVDVVPFDDTAKVYQLKPGDVLRNDANGNVDKDTITEADTLITGWVPSPKDSVAVESNESTSSQTPSKDRAAIREKLTPTPGNHSPATEQTEIEASTAIEKERQETAEKIQKERVDHNKKKQEIETNHEKMKAEAEAVPEKEREKSIARLSEETTTSAANLDEARSVSQKNLQKEKKSLRKKAITPSSNKSDDAFDELRRRREGQ